MNKQNLPINPLEFHLKTYNAGDYVYAYIYMKRDSNKDEFEFAIF
jgi:hypothetical protein